MLKNKTAIRLFSSGLQAIGVQVIGTAFFYIISVYLTKDSFGIISWVNAVSVFITVILGFGLEQVVVRRIAASNRSDWAAAAFFIHALIGSIIAFIVLLILSETIKSGAINYKILPWFFTAQALIYIGVPLKQFLNAKEEFTPYGVIAVISNSCKIVMAWYLFRYNVLDIHIIAIIMIGTACFELGCLLIYLITKTTFGFKFHIKAYRKLIKESSAQYLSVIFDMSLSRIDWILLGIITSNVILADYSFAYRAYEMARLPMLIIAPVILPRISRLMAFKSNLENEQQSYINSFNRVELFFAVLIVLTLNILWVPVVGLITHSKYGSSNSLQFLILSLCIPLQFFINLLWSLSFGAKMYKAVTTITITCAVTNLVLNLALISLFDGLGAAIAFVITTLLQAFLYYRLVNRKIMNISLWPFMVLLFIAAVIYFVTIQFHIHFLLQLIIGISAYLLIALFTRQINKQHIHNFKHFIAK